MSLAELPELIGFFSYSREDDIGSGGRLTKLRERIQEELRSQLGRRKGNFRVWQDKTAIADGTLWSDEIRTAVDQSVFFVPIITPTAIKSDYCKAEFEHFLDREKELGRSDLVFPILYIRVPELENETQWRQNSVLKIVGDRQYLDWLELRHLSLDSKEVGVAIDRFCRSIHDALYRPWLSPEERRLQQERERQEAERAAEQEEARRRKQADDEARRQKEAEDEKQRQKQADDEARRQKEAEGEEQRRKQADDEARRQREMEAAKLRSAMRSDDTGAPAGGAPSHVIVRGARSAHIAEQEASEKASIEREIKESRTALYGSVIGMAVSGAAFYVFANVFSGIVGLILTIGSVLFFIFLSLQFLKAVKQARTAKGRLRWLRR